MKENMKKLNEIKETYAKELGYKDWETCINDQPNHNVETLMDEVALRLYSVRRSATDIDKINKRFDDCEELLTKFDGKNFMALVLAATYIGESYAYNN